MLFCMCANWNILSHRFRNLYELTLMNIFLNILLTLLIFSLQVIVQDIRLPDLVRLLFI